MTWMCGQSLCVVVVASLVVDSNDVEAQAVAEFPRVKSSCGGPGGVLLLVIADQNEMRQGALAGLDGVRELKGGHQAGLLLAASSLWL